MHEAGHGEGGGTPSSGMGGHIYNCGGFMLIYGKTHQNIVKNYSPIKLMIKKKKKKNPPANETGRRSVPGPGSFHVPQSS